MGAAAVMLAAMLLVYSQYSAFSWDEGFHLVTAWLLATGKQPYRDFIFAQTPLNAWWNALLIRVTGIGWRVPHAAAALELALAAWLTADYVLRRFAAGSRLIIACAVAALIGTNVIVVQFGTVGQAYGLSILLGVLAFRFAISGRSALSGLAAGAAAASSLLTAPLGPILLVWSIFQGGWRRGAAFAAGSAVGLSPVIVSFVQAPRQFLFDVMEFHLHYRQVEWSTWKVHDLEIATAFLNSAQGLTVVGLTFAGAIIGRKRTEARLLIWMVAIWSLYLATTHPTFAQYFIVEAPFAALLAAMALEDLFGRYPRRWPAALVIAFMVASFGRAQWEERDDTSWGDLTKVSQAVKEVLTPDKKLYAEEQTYLLTGRVPPPGMEWTSSHKVEMPLDRARPLHLIPQSELDRQIKRGDFPVLETCEEVDVDRLELKALYGNTKKVVDCWVFWDFKRP